MMKKPITTKAPAEQVVKDIRSATRKLHSSEKKAPRYYPPFVVRTALLRFAARKVEECQPTVRGTVGPTTAQSLYYSWSKKFLEAGEVKDLRAEASALKQLMADLGFENLSVKYDKRGNRTEIMFGRLKEWRRLATP